MKNAIALMAIVLIALSSGACSREASETATQAATQSAPPPVEISTTTVVERSIQRSIETVGTLFPDEEAIVRNEVEGTIEEMNVELGSPVQRGQVIARLSPRQFELKVQQAKAALEQARARLGLRGDSDQIDPEQTTEVKQARAALDDARLKFERARRLIANGDISQQRFDEAEVNLRAAEARYQAARDSIHNQLALIEQRRSELAMAEKSLNDSIIRATISGSVSEKFVSRGDRVGVNSQIVKLVKIEMLKLRADLPEPYAPQARVGQEITFSVDALPGNTFRGRVARISPAVNEKTRSLTIEALIDNRDRMLKPGLFAHVKVLSSRPAQALMIPVKAIVSFAGINKAFVVEGDHVAERQLKLGARDGELVEIVDGLRSGERIALTNLERLANGATVSVRSQVQPAQ